MISEAKAFWDSISGKVKSLIRKETENAMRLQRYDVTTAPNGTVMGVRQPFGNNEIFLPYSQEVASATVGDTVLVAWWGSMSNAKVYFFAEGYEGTAGAGLPTGGTAGQGLLKTGPDDYQAGWGDVVTSVNGQTGDVTVREPGLWTRLTTTYTANSYVSETAFNRIYAFSNGEILVLVINLDVDASPGNTFRTIGKINLPSELFSSVLLTVASQSGGANLLINISYSTGVVQIYNAYGTATGWYRATAIMPLESAFD